ncbi:hypothetical protein SAM19_00302 [Brevibacillus laterosporus]|nr:hypothetical protein [Brevibacillus laterosporus]
MYDQAMGGFSIEVICMPRRVIKKRSPLQDDKNHKCYRCVWASYAGYKILCSKQVCVREQTKNLGR